MAKIVGNKVYIAVGGTVIEGVLSTSVSENVEAIDATTQDSNGSKEYLAGDYDADINVEGKFDDTHSYGETQLRTALNAKAAVTVTWGEGLDTASKQVLSASCIVTSLETNAGGGSDTKNWSASFKVTGGITESTSSATVT